MAERRPLEQRPADVPIVPMRPDHVPAAVEVLAASLGEDPAYRHLLPDPGRRRRALRAIVGAGARDALPFGASTVALAGDRVLAAAVWLPPGAFPMSSGRKVRSAPTFLDLVRIAPRAVARIARFSGRVERAFPDEPLWYLEVLGVHPEAQGKSVGTRLLEPTLARADAERVGSYLETSNPRNLTFYGRLGFEVDREGLQLLPDGPTHWRMRRPPPASRPVGGDRPARARRRRAP